MPSEFSDRPAPTKFPPRWIFPALLVVLVGLAWSNTFTAPFEMDDGSSIAENPTIRDLASWHWLHPPAGRGETVSGRPILNLTFAVDYAFGGLAVRGYHITNLLIHVLGALTLFGLVRRTLSRSVASAAALAFAIAALWALHPLQTGAITYIVQRAESLMALFYLLTLYTFIRVCGAAGGAPGAANAGPCSPQPAGGSAWWLGLSVGCCLLGMGTKENMVSAPVAVLLFDRAFVAGSLTAALRRRAAYYVALIATWVPLTLLVVTTGGNRGGTAGFDVGVRWFDYLLTQFPALARYLALSFWPHPLVFEYGPSWVQSARAVGGVIAIALVVVGAVAYALLRHPRLGAIGFVGLAVLAPAALVPGTLQMIVEYRMYLPLAGVVTVAVLAGARLWGALRQRSLWAAVTAAIVALAALTYARNAVYASELSLWADTVAKRPDNPRAHNNLGLALQHSGRVEAAMVEFRRAIALQPNHAYAHGNLGGLLLQRREWSDAAGQFAIAVAADPDLLDARINLGIALVHLGRRPEAEEQFRRALEQAPRMPDVETELAAVLLDEGRNDEAERLVRDALARKPGLAQAHLVAGQLAERNGGSGAEAEYREAIRLEPALSAAHLALGNLLAARSADEEARTCYERAIELEPQSAEPRFGLGSLLARQRQFAAALDQFDAAIRLAPDHFEARANRGNCELVLGRSREAIADYEWVLQRRPQDARIRHNLAVAQQMLNDESR